MRCLHFDDLPEETEEVGLVGEGTEDQRMGE